MTPLSRYEMDALCELGRHMNKGLGRACPYWWRKASMRKLAAKGLVERDPRWGTDAQPAWILSDAGSAFLRGFPEDSP